MTNATKLSVGDIVSNSLSIGMKNFVPLLITGILYIITIWIPYLNLGTTIGIWDLVAKLGRGEKINPTDIFDEKYRRRIGDFFLLLAFLAAGMIAGFIVPGAGTVIQIAWMLALPLFVDKETDPMESITMSNRLMHGNKLTVFLAMVILGVAMGVGALILMFIGSQIHEFLGLLLLLVVYAVVLPVYLGMIAYVYARLGSGSSEQAVAEAVM